MFYHFSETGKDMYFSAWKEFSIEQSLIQISGKNIFMLDVGFERYFDNCSTKHTILSTPLHLIACHGNRKAEFAKKKSTPQKL